LPLSPEANNILPLDAQFAELRLVAPGRARHPINRRTTRPCGFLAIAEWTIRRVLPNQNWLR
jgi:hypothetical protein